jgi:hypothetical protein
MSSSGNGAGIIAVIRTRRTAYGNGRALSAPEVKQAAKDSTGGRYAHDLLLPPGDVLRAFLNRF